MLRFRRHRTSFFLAVTVGLLLAASATSVAIKIRAGDIVITADGGFRPTTLPSDHDAPITIYGGGSISTTSGRLPPVLKAITLEYDRHGSVKTKGLAACTGGRLEASTVSDARRRCPGAVVGKGRGRGVVAFPEQAPIPVSSPITIFNGPRKHGNPTVLAHFYTTIPVPTAFVIPIEIRRINKGTYGYRTEAKIPRIAGGHGIPLAGHLTIGRKWTFRGRRYSYLNARCETGRLWARGDFTFRDGTRLRATFARRCQARH